MTAFKNPSPWDDFQKGRESDMLRQRLAFVQHLEQLHTRTLAKHTSMKSREDEQQAFRVWKRNQAQGSDAPEQKGPLMPCLACLALQSN